MATIDEILPRLKRFAAVLVTGPQRSGTTIGAHIIAIELGYQYIDEKDFGVHFPERAKRFIERGNIVLQAPALCHVAHTFGCVVVMMRRPLCEIHASESRISWPRGEAARELGKYGVRVGDPAALKYERWDSTQKSQCIGFDLDYHSLETHPLWVAEDKRKMFRKRQWSLGTTR